MVPQGMTSQVHEFDAREGGAFRISLTYGGPGGTGTTTASTDTYHGRFVRLVPRELVVQTMAFETSDAAMRGEMTATYPHTIDHGAGERITFLRRVPVATGHPVEGENVASPGAGPPMHVTTTSWSRSRCSADAWAISGRADPTVGLKLMSHDPAGPSSRPRWSTPARAWTK